MRKHWSHVFKSAHDLTEYWSPVFEYFKDMVLILDQSLTVYHANQAWVNFIATDDTRVMSPLLQDKFADYIYFDDLYQFKQSIANTEHLDRYRLRMMDGRGNLHWYEISATPILISGYNTSLWCLICSDQTIRIKQEYLEFAQQRSLRDLLSRLPVMLYRSRNDRDWTMEYVSCACTTITGYTAESLLNTPLYGQIIHQDDTEQVWSQVQYAIHHKSLFHLSYRIVRADQKILQVQEIGQGLYSDSDMVLGVEGVIFSQ
ncbi:PAS domain-containing protein [Acinetobacter soli]|uniref:PAS domain-containing protein n=1 Tax=Acinetobacter soli TaxID=487316 RepID=UPI001231308D|nr:PAS domain-containing protein [Acinetobacter soli]WOQ37293.1 PAS domain-containing protein [Acinetobacter soli]